MKRLTVYLTRVPQFGESGALFQALGLRKSLIRRLGKAATAM